MILIVDSDAAVYEMCLQEACEWNMASIYLFLHVRHCKVTQMGGTEKAQSSPWNHLRHQLQVKHLDEKIFWKSKVEHQLWIYI